MPRMCVGKVVIEVVKPGLRSNLWKTEVTPTIVSVVIMLSEPKII